MASTTDHVDTAAWRITPITARVGVVVRAFDPRAADAAALKRLRSLLADHGVVVLAEQQHFTPDDHRRLGEALGQIKPPPHYIPTVPGFDEIAEISTENGLAYVTDQWHADVTWLAAPPKYSILHMVEPPPSGGDTMWSSQTEAFDWLSEPLQHFLAGLTAEHVFPADTTTSTPHPVVISHPLTGRKAMFVNSVFTKRIVELREDESDALLAYLFSHSTRPELTCRWSWSQGDVAIWDNHFVQHYAVGDYHPARRTIQRVEIEGDPPLPASV